MAKPQILTRCAKTPKRKTRKMDRMDTHLLPNHTRKRKPKHNAHITDEMWGKHTTWADTHEAQQQDIAPHQLLQIREASPLMQLIQQSEIEKWITRPYSIREIQNTIIHLKNNKATGSDRIPGEIYTAPNKHLSHFITHLMNNIMHGQPTPGQWTEGGIIHIRKKETKLECANYRPICLTQIIYEIRYKLLTARLAQIIHLLTSTTQYGYKRGLSAIDAIVKNRTSYTKRTKRYSNHTNRPFQIIWMCKS